MLNAKDAACEFAASFERSFSLPWDFASSSGDFSKHSKAHQQHPHAVTPRLYGSEPCLSSKLKQSSPNSSTTEFISTTSITTTTRTTHNHNHNNVQHRHSNPFAFPFEEQQFYQRLLTGYLPGPSGSPVHLLKPLSQDVLGFVDSYATKDVELRLEEFLPVLYLEKDTSPPYLSAAITYSSSADNKRDALRTGLEKAFDGYFGRLKHHLLTGQWRMVFLAVKEHWLHDLPWVVGRSLRTLSEKEKQWMLRFEREGLHWLKVIPELPFLLNVSFNFRPYLILICYNRGSYRPMSDGLPISPCRHLC